MRYADYLKRMMDKLTPDAWEALITTAAAPVQKLVLLDCPCCQSVVAIEMGVTCRPVIDRCELQAMPDSEDALAPFTPATDPLADTQIELAAITQTDLVLA